MRNKNSCGKPRGIFPFNLSPTRETRVAGDPKESERALPFGNPIRKVPAGGRRVGVNKMRFLILVAAAAMLFACKKHDPHPNTVIVGTILGPETTLMSVAKKVAMQDYHLKIKIVPFQSYDEPNAALESGTIEANAYQTRAYLKQQIDRFDYSFTILGNTFMYPMGLYSDAISNLSALKSGDTVVVPNDPSNLGRALLLLQSAGLITVNGYNPNQIGISQINHNPMQLHIVPVSASELPEMIHHAKLAAINTNYAKMINLLPDRDALFVEPQNKLYMNLIVTRSDIAAEPKMQKLVKAYQSNAVLQEAKKLFGNNALPGFFPVD